MLKKGISIKRAKNCENQERECWHLKWNTEMIGNVAIVNLDNGTKCVKKFVLRQSTA